VDWIICGLINLPKCLTCNLENIIAQIVIFQIRCRRVDLSTTTDRELVCQANCPGSIVWGYQSTRYTVKSSFMTSWLKQSLACVTRAHIIVTSLLWQLDCSLLVILALRYIGPARSVELSVPFNWYKRVTSWLVASWLISDLGRFWPVTSQPCEELTVFLVWIPSNLLCHCSDMLLVILLML